MPDDRPAPERFDILATQARADERTRVLKHGETFAVFDQYGDVVPGGLGEQGIYHQGARHLSRLALRLDEVRPLLLSSTVRANNDLFQVDLSNPDLPLDGGGTVPRGTLHVFRTKFLWEGTCHERIQIANYGLTPVAVSLQLAFDADFADIFEVRGTRRARRGERQPDLVVPATLVLAYHGLDGMERRTRIELHPAPHSIAPGRARFDLALTPQQAVTLDVTVRCEAGPSRPPVTFDAALASMTAGRGPSPSGPLTVHSSNRQFGEWLSRSVADLNMMLTATPHGPYPYAGIPWFSAPFGRDGLLTALALLWANPEPARGVLGYLAATQARQADAARDAEPGKILHEARLGEMAALGEVPFGRYYGSVDATPLFVVLAGLYLERTDDRAFLETIWPAIERALAWIDESGDVDGDGFVEYARRTPTGLMQQGWKDSTDSVFHADGRLAQGPIALAEVQAYVYAARRQGAAVARALGNAGLAERQAQAGERLRLGFETAFWSEELSSYVLALDGAKQPCRVRASNAGHCLFAEIASPLRARRVAATLLDKSLFSGWGIRTLAAIERRYNPMSYHNGSVWPHDNAFIALGLSRYGLKEPVLEIASAQFDAAIHMDLQRMPELFCGFERRPGEGPILYPVACAPQAWSAASVFMLLQACLGLRIDAPRRRIIFDRPALPESLERIRLTGLTVAEVTVDVQLERHARDVGVQLVRRTGDIEVLVSH